MSMRVARCGTTQASKAVPPFSLEKMDASVPFDRFIVMSWMVTIMLVGQSGW